MKKGDWQPARLAGTCYPSSAEGIIDFFRDFFGKPGAARLPGAEETETSAQDSFLGVVAPHIDFRVSTKAYSWAFASWFETAVVDRYIVLGVGHRTHQEWSTLARGYLTPLGEVHVDAAAVHALIDAVDEPILGDPALHDPEHSIEFPLICLQAMRRLRGIDRPFQFVPLLCGGLFELVHSMRAPAAYPPLQQLAEALRAQLNDSDASAQIILSIDGCHIGPRFRHPRPVDPAQLEECARWEERLWEQVEAGSLDGFFDVLREDGNHRYFDGVGALALLMATLPQGYRLQRSCYEQWFEPSDASVVTFTGGRLDRAVSTPPVG